MNINDYKDIVVFVEQRNSKLESVGLGLICEARKLANISAQKVIAVLLGANIKELSNTLISYGADKVIFVDSPELKTYCTEPYSQALFTVLSALKPNIVLMGATTLGRDLAPRMSVKLKTGLTADCTQLEMKLVEGYDTASRVTEHKDLLMTRPTFGGNLIATIICPEHRPQMATVRSGVMAKMDPDNSRKGEIEEMTIQFDSSLFKVEVVKEVKQESNKKDITQESVLIASGRGIKKIETFDNIKSIAKQIKAGVASSRALVDKGWADHDMQVGQTGKTVHPDLYIALGISGAVQHTVGMEGSGYIIAVNTDKNAPMLQMADLGIVCDVEPVVANILRELNK